MTEEFSLRNPTFSIIIPCKTIGVYELECIAGCSRLNYKNFEVLILPDTASSLELEDPRFRVAPTGHKRPSAKRNLGIRLASGEIIAMIDSDAYPDKYWLTNALKYFRDRTVAGVGGPSLTPEEDNLRQKATGAILGSRIATGKLACRYTPSKLAVDDDLPTCNLMIRKAIFERLGGFNVDYWPGEDTYLCLQITKGLGMRIVYSPDVVVYHHRRPLFLPYLRQIWSYGLHRGFFAKRYPETSRRPLYFAPSMLLVGLVSGIPLSLMNFVLGVAFVALASVYLAMCLFEGLKTRNLKLLPLVFSGVISTHLTYGAAFLKGLLVRRIRE
ncbi:MAG: glycosyltransferase [Candidatus Bathyarchaeia archaeon]